VKVDFKRLRTSVEWSIRELEFPRNKRHRLIQQYVGSHYAEGGAERRVPTNMLELAVTIYLRNLAANAPRVMVTTPVDHLKPYAMRMALALNQLPGEIHLARSIRRAVLEALFGIGVAKVGLCESAREVNGMNVGDPFVDVVSLDDYFVDMTAKSRDAIQYEGNDYWLDVDAARDMFDGDSSKIEPDDHTVHGDQGERRAEQVGTQEGGDPFKDRVWLRDVWLPDSGELLTYGVKSHKVFRTVPFDGPEGSPFHVLSYGEVPGNLMPLPPATLWLDLHELGNTLFRKLARQAEAKKRVAAFPGGNDASVEALKKAMDGEGIRYNGAKPEMLDVGGIDQPTLAFYLQTRDLFSYFAGNLDALGGLGPMTDTVGQDQLLSQAASSRMASMKSDTLDFTRGIWKSLAWYEWTDPLRSRQIEITAEGTDIVLTREWSEETREGNFLDFNLDVDPYSMEDDSPALKLQKVSQALERFVFPMLPILQQQGAQIDVRRLLELVAKLADVDELRELVVFGEPIQGEPQQGGDPSASFKPAHTTRTYERVNRPGATRHGKDDVMSRLLMGGGVQQSEAASLGRPTT
jgi:hypothetical protein